MGVLRALWDHQASDTNSRLILHIPDFSLIQSLRACPASFASEITEWLHETARMLLSSSTSQVHTSPTSALLGSYTSADLGMHLAHASLQTGLSPLSYIPPELVYEHVLVTTFSLMRWRGVFRLEPFVTPGPGETPSRVNLC